MKVLLTLCIFVVACIAAVLSIDCRLVFCPHVTVDICRNQSQAFIRKDGVKHCCDYCQDVDEAINIDRSKCDPKKCWTVRCGGLLTEESCQVGQAMVPYDSTCFCCDTCVDLKAKCRL